MKLEKVSGIVSHFRLDARVVGSGDRLGGSVDTQHASLFRVADRQVAVRGAVAVADGDRVTVVGIPADGGISVLGWANHSTGIVYAPSTNVWFCRGVSAVAVVAFLGGLLNAGGLLAGLAVGATVAAIPGWFAFIIRRSIRRDREVARLLQG